MTKYFHVSDATVGYFHSGLGLGYGVSGFIGAVVLIYLSNVSTMVLGNFLSGFTTMMVGPSHLLGFEPSLTLTYIGLLTSGMCSGFLYVPAYPEV